MRNIIKNIITFFSRSKKITVKVSSVIAKKPGESTCDSCHKNVSTFMGGRNGQVTCLECCDKENEGVEFRWENDDKEKQVVEYNAYKDGEKIRGVNISYFTSEQCDEIDRINEKLYKEIHKR